MANLRIALAALATLSCSALAPSQALALTDALLQPYTLAYTRTATPLDSELPKVKARLQQAGFEVIGEYSPYANAEVVAITSPALKAAATPGLTAFAAVEHVSLTTVGDELQVSYLNPHYVAGAYRVQDGLESVAQQLEKALGAQRGFGADSGRTTEQLQNYHYMAGMERFDNTYELATYSTQEEALKVVEQNLRNAVGGAAKVYRLDLPGHRTVFGISRAQVVDQRANDKHILADTVDPKFSIKTTAYLPYQLLVDNGHVRALHMRFRLAVWHPDLTMVTFGKLITSPGAIQTLLTKIAGGQ